MEVTDPGEGGGTGNAQTLKESCLCLERMGGLGRSRGRAEAGGVGEAGLYKDRVNKLGTTRLTREGRLKWCSFAEACLWVGPARGLTLSLVLLLANRRRKRERRNTSGRPRSWCWVSALSIAYQRWGDRIQYAGSRVWGERTREEFGTRFQRKTTREAQKAYSLPYEPIPQGQGRTARRRDCRRAAWKYPRS